MTMRVVSVAPEHHRGKPARGERHCRSRKPIRYAVVTRGARDDLLKA